MYSVFTETLAGKRQFIPFGSKLPMTERNCDYYLSLFQYTDEQRKLVEERGSLKAAHIKDTTTNQLYFDFDSKDSLEAARKDSLVVVDRLINNQGVSPDDIIATFTGSKGFSISLQLKSRITNAEFKVAVQRLAGDLKTFDHVVSDPNRIVRITNTKHQVTGNYKIPLDLWELEELSIQDILDTSKHVRSIEIHAKPTDLANPEDLFALEEAPKKEAVTNVSLKEALEGRPKYWKDYKWALVQGFFDNGERHSALMVVAATCRGLGYDKETAYYMCKSALKKQSARTGNDEFSKEELWENIIESSVYSDEWEGGQYSPKTNPWLKKYCERMGFEVEEKEEATPIKRIQDIQDAYKHFVDHIEENTVKTGIRVLDEDLPLTTGMNLGVVGAASSGKTALALDILKNTSKAGVVSVFASLDMHSNRLFEKLLYKTTGLNRDELHAKVKAGEDVYAKIREDYANVWFYDRSCPTIANIREYIENIERETGQKVKLVMLDYFERVNSEKSEDTAASKDIAGQLQDLVNDLNVCMITLVQPNKFSLSGGPNSPIMSYTAIKGSSFLYQSFRSIISIWRPFFTPEEKENDKYMQMAILKNDLGEIGLYNFSWNGKKGEIKEMTEEQEGQFDYLMQEKASKANKKDQGGWE